VSRTVFILGAGASRQAGAPLMSEFLEVARELHRSRRVGPHARDFELVLEGLSHLQYVESKFSLKFRNIEAAFAAFEMAGVAGRLGAMDPDRVELLPAAMNRLIFRTLELTIVFPKAKGEARLYAPVPYGDFVNLMRRLNGGGPRQRSSVITLNYDLCLDYALHVQQIPIDYCLRKETAVGGFRLMKLHGSLNWGVCAECEEVSPCRLDKGLLADSIGRRSSVREGSLNVASKIASRTHSCGHAFEPDPFIVPPTWNKTMHSSQLAPVWSAAARELAEAEEIIVIGYSLPPTDSFFRYLLAMGAAGPAVIDKFWVLDPAERVGEKFGNLLGPAAAERYSYVKKGFADAIRHLEQRLKR